MNNIKFVDPLITEKEKGYFRKAFNSGWLSYGPYVEKFEKKLSNTLGAKFGISVNNGTSAILLILMGLNLKKDDEIIIPSLLYKPRAHDKTYGLKANSC